jgi:hypothetical protein
MLAVPGRLEREHQALWPFKMEEPDRVYKLFEVVVHVGKYDSSTSVRLTCSIFAATFIMGTMLRLLQALMNSSGLMTSPPRRETFRNTFTSIFSSSGTFSGDRWRILRVGWCFVLLLPAIRSDLLHCRAGRCRSILLDSSASTPWTVQPRKDK